MFDSLRKRLQDAVKKVAQTIAHPAEEEPVQMVEEPRVEVHQEKKEAAQEAIQAPALTTHEQEPEIEEKHVPVIEEIPKEEILKEGVPAVQAVVEEKKEKPSMVRSLFKKISEKELSLGDVEPFLRELELALLESDVAVDVAEHMMQTMKSKLVGTTVSRGKAEEAVKQALKDAVYEVLAQEPIDIEARIEQADGPLTIVLLGFNGTGKTTTLAKLAYRFKKYQPVIAAGDTFRAASIEQLMEHGKRLDVPVIKQAYSSDSAAVIFDARKHAQAIHAKLVLADTAGRSHANANLMDELKKVCRVNNPDVKILVLDALAGNDIVEQARLFNEAVGVDALILTKADVYDKGGAALSAVYTIKKPILFLGTGQEYEEFEAFDPKKIATMLVE